METSFLSPSWPSRMKQVQDAKDMYETVKRNAERSGSEVPPYEFIELIGKGAFGRVYKCRHTETKQLVAVKILNIDDADFAVDARERDEAIKDFRKEVEILNQLKDYKAKNVNMIHTAFDLHSQLWIVSDFCTGGSVRTLMRANPNRGLEEHYIRPIARELAIALKSVHDIGVIHRDIKCANIYVTEDGRIQLGDFGVVGVMDNGVAKRTTIIGTPWYMPKEMHVDSFSVTQGYGKEVDIWAFGCTVFEMASGTVPNATVAQHMLGSVLEQQAPRLTGDEYSDDLRDFVAFCLKSDPQARPTADQILKHPFVAGTRADYPTHSLVALIDRYIVWEHRGGQRTSLFNPGGAAAPVSSDGPNNNPQIETDDWNFNTTDSFYGGFAKRYSQMVVEDYGPQFEAPPGSGLPPSSRAQALTPLEMIQREHAAKSESRGERSLQRIWNPDVAPYDAHNNASTHQSPVEPANDLPLREYSSDSAPRESTLFIDLDTTPSLDPGSAFNFDFDNIQTVKAAKQRSSIADDSEEQTFHGSNDEKRSTMAWTFPSTADAQPKRATMDWTFPSEPSAASLEAEADIVLNATNNDVPFRPQLKHTATAPLGQFGDFIHSGPLYRSSSPPRASLGSLIDLSLDIPDTDPDELSRPSTAVSYTGSTSTVMTQNPFDLDDDRSSHTDQSRFSIHKQWLSEGGNGDRSSLRKVPMHLRGNSLTSTDSEFDRASDRFDSDYESEHYRTNGSMSASAAPTMNSMWDNENMDTERGTGIRSRRQVGDFRFPSLSGTTLNDGSNYTRQGSRPRERQQQHDLLDFPMPQPPNPEALFDQAEDDLVIEELRRLLRDAGTALKSTAVALQRHAEVDADAFSGFDDAASVHSAVDL